MNARHSFFQIGIAVPDLEQAMGELGVALGVDWIGPKTREFGSARLRATFARTGPPYIELIEGSPGSIWSAESGPFIHHLGYWSDDQSADAARLESGGVHLELDLGHARYFRGEASGTRIELIDSTHKQTFSDRWGLPSS